ncbi:putative cytokinetic ring protein SteA [Tsukamurella tyrosinosolvens]|uniref:putative cytokinetic ring protein SteA n=1 Tax=Tsukamurella tyrosinosolvens TaxID=57704 RepID=UPI000C7F6054|nr:putative cytokinetic ring protein SteA [Tsukamurella tyrosinosolvens]AUN40785.1 thiamine pyrophosphokinase [Tsukamurella tyrosinosolvens]MEC4615429.1 putative cytokinetic ring protein SteA [Tsukamurella tyrosinosolvens]QRY83544.1 thiamine pyrophosphokinase [Tsukamurella tyrosinosolvens]
MKLTGLLSRNTSNLPGVTGTARVDKDTTRLLGRIGRGDIVVCDELDLDRTTADLMVEAGVAAVVNASPFISGRYPNLGPEVLAAAGIELVDDAGKEVFSRIKDGAKIRVHEGVVYTGERELAQGESLTDTDVTSRMLAARSGVVDHLEAFAGNTVEFIRVESPLLIDGVGIPDVEVNLNNRHVLVVSDGADHVEDLKRLKPFIKEYAPVLIGVNRGADALVKAGYRPDLIVGDPEMITTNTLRSGAQVVLPAAPDGHAPGLERIQDLGIGAMTFPATGSAADLALIIADHHGASLIVSVGHSASLEEFFDAGRRESNPSTFLTRLKVGTKLVDGKAVATLYRSRGHGGAIALFILAALVAVVAAVLVSNQGHDLLQWVIDQWNRFALWVQGQFRAL